MSVADFPEVLSLPSLEDKDDCACGAVSVNWCGSHRVYSCGCGDFRMTIHRSA